MTLLTRRTLRRAATRHQFRPCVRQLESRLAPATFTVLSTANSGTGSLRQAISDANTSAGADVIQFDSTVFDTPRTIKLTTGELLITGALSINGPTGKVTISGNNASRIFHLQSATKGLTVSMANLILTAANSTTEGAAIWAENAPDVMLTNCLIHGNTYVHSAVDIESYPVDNSGGKFTAIDCAFNNNSGITNNSTISVLGHGSSTIMKRSTISDNIGRGLRILKPISGADLNGYLLIEDCTISGNQGHSGAGVNIYADFAPDQCAIRNTTISGNSANNIAGGIYFLSNDTLVVQNSTISSNTAGKSHGAGITCRSSVSTSVVALESTIVTGNVSIEQGLQDIEALSPNGKFSYKNSSIFTPTSSTLINLGGNRPFGEDPLLAPLADNGGPTKTHALVFSSPVANKGSNPANLTNDQRGTGNPRSFNGGVDIGAYEITKIQVDTTVDEFDGNYSTGDLSLREAISLTAFPAVYFDPVVFATPQTITLTMGVFAIPGGRTIIGPAGKVTVNANNASRIFFLTPTGPNVQNNFSNLILTGGNAGTGQGGAIFGSGFGFGGVSVTLNNCTLTGNTATTGGAIGIGSGTLTIEDCTLTNNTANGFGGGGSGGAISASFTAMKTFIRRSTISGNTAASGAGGVYIYGSTYQSGISLVEDCTISNNKTPGDGGGLALKGNANTVRNCTISGNTAGRGGGIALIIGGTAVIQNSTIVYNTATVVFGAGGGISASVAIPQIFLESSIVSKNTAPSGPDIAAAGTVTHKTSSIFSSAGVSSFNDLGGNRPFGEEPLLGPLDDNGGPMLTHKLLPGSPVIDQGSNPALLVNDQRGIGYARVYGPAADMGALEPFVPTLIPAFPESVTLNDYAPQRSRVTHWYITFAGTPTLPMNPADAFQVVRQSDNALVQFTVTTVGSDVQLDFTGGPLEFGSLQDGRYTVRIFAAQIPNLDANDDGIVGDSFELIGDPTNRVFRLFGDENGDGTVAANDFIQFRLSLGGTNPVFDFDGDGAVAASDFIQFRLRFGGSV